MKILPHLLFLGNLSGAEKGFCIIVVMLVLYQGLIVLKAIFKKK
jgi:hypothetical protein